MFLRVFGGLTAASLALCLVWWTVLKGDESSVLSVAPFGLIVFAIPAATSLAFWIIARRTDQRTAVVAQTHPNVALHQFMADTPAVLALRRLGSENGGRRIRSLNGAYVTVVVDRGSLWIYAGASAWLVARVDTARVARVEPARISTTRGGWWPGVRFQIADQAGSALVIDVLPIRVARGTMRKSLDVAGELSSIRKELEASAAIQ
ncbi:hypothetical protein E3O44_17275 [Cryobacterium algoricola]|uniref:PH domain-containing protein n=1 Tax=Cryobacterium algoricola TaxID=1259183 RepID=A0ABY2IA23_9MICO|nr:hypothetical protein [Cryobacterium algoricola]TFB83622.1 hypothetical protein E3O44_17275 [Cryobacterium algoricola]